MHRRGRLEPRNDCTLMMQLIDRHPQNTSLVFLPQIQRVPQVIEQSGQLLTPPHLCKRERRVCSAHICSAAGDQIRCMLSSVFVYLDLLVSASSFLLIKYWGKGAPAYARQTGKHKQNVRHGHVKCQSFIDKATRGKRLRSSIERSKITIRCNRLMKDRAYTTST